MLKIKRMMLQKGIKSYRELTRLSGVNNISELDRGFKLPGPGELEKIAAALGVPVEELR